MPESYALTRLLNQLFGGIVTSIMQMMGIHPANPGAPISNTFSIELIVVAGLIAFFIVGTSLSPDKPGRFSTWPNDLGVYRQHGRAGHRPWLRKFQAYVTCIFLFVLCQQPYRVDSRSTRADYISRGSARPRTADISLLQLAGVPLHGIGYLKQFAGPIWWMAWLLIPIELVSHFARIMSLTIRLYANMYASDMLTLGFFSLIPIGVPSVFLGLHVFVSCIQAFIFMLLTMIYLSLAVSHEAH